MADYRVEKERREATLMLSNGLSVHGCVFLSPESATGRRREGIKEVLNSENGFFPFEVREHGTPHTALYHREHVVFLTIPPGEESSEEPGYDVATTQSVAILLADGRRLNGRVRMYCPPGRDRLSDYARSPEVFRYLECHDCTYIVNTRHVVELRETGEP